MIKILVEKKEKVNSWQDALKKTGETLYQNGCVKEDFSRACIEREELFPTGIPNSVPVAMPHADASHVRESAISVLVLEQPVNFVQMDNPEKMVECFWVFNLSLDNGNDHLEILKKLMVFIQQSELLTANRLKSSEIIKSVLEEHLV